MKRPPLHRLKSGEWIDLASAASIQPWRKDRSFEGTKPCVVITGQLYRIAVEFKTLKAAQAYADELAEIRNSYDLES